MRYVIGLHVILITNNRGASSNLAQIFAPAETTSPRRKACPFFPVLIGTFLTSTVSERAIKCSVRVHDNRRKFPMVVSLAWPDVSRL